MIEVNPEIRESFLRESTKKQLLIDVYNENGKTLREINLCTSPLGYSHDIEAAPHGEYRIYANNYPEWTKDFIPYQLKGRYSDYPYMSFSMAMTIYNAESVPSELYLQINYITTENKGYTSSQKFVPVVGELQRVNASFKTNLGEYGFVKEITGVYISNRTDNETLKANIGFGNYMILVGNDVNDTKRDYIETSPADTDINEYSVVTIDNNKLTAESFTLTESLCSQQNLKFGLCEASHCEFTVVDDELNLSNKQIRPHINIPNAGKPLEEVVKNINFQELHNPEAQIARWANIKASNWKYTEKLWKCNFKQYVDKNYFDYNKYACFSAKVKLNITGSFQPVKFKFAIYIENSDGAKSAFWQPFYNNVFFNVSDFTEDFGFVKIYYSLLMPEYYAADYGTYLELSKYGAICFYDENGQTYGNDVLDLVEVSFKELRVNIVDEPGNSIPSYNAQDNHGYNNDVDEYIDNEVNASIPLGVFDVSSVKKQNERTFSKKTITAYDKLTLLSQNAFDWYSNYMFGLTFYGYTGLRKLQFTRQIYSTFFNYMRKIGIMKRDSIKEKSILHINRSTLESSHISDKEFMWDWKEYTYYMILTYYNITVNNVDSSKRYVVDFANYNNESDEYVFNHYITRSYKLDFDSKARGTLGNCSLFIECKDEQGNIIANYAIDRGDYFCVPRDTKSFVVYVARGFKNPDGGAIWNLLVENLTVSEVEGAVELENKHINLCYFNYGTGEIFPAETSITGRDVVRSLLEVCGCFFRLDRKNGEPEFVYCTKSGLYPSNDLYPSDDLYPRQLDGDVLGMGKYLGYEAEDYEVQNYGCIQIQRKDTTNSNKKVCEWEYVGNSNLENAYIIDDNIFYCSKDMQYDYDLMPEVSEMLVNMYQRIANMGYVPNVTQAIGMPYIECGDRIGLLSATGGVQSFIFRRTLKGIQTLYDTYESTGDKLTPAIKNYGYTLVEGT